MLVAYSILLVLYIGLVFLYVYTRKKPTSFPTWPLLSVNNSTEWNEIDCGKHDDCPSNHVCLNKKCVQKFLKDGTCQEETGRWQRFEIKGRFFATCQCTDERLFTQPVLGADCTLSVACGIHGKYDISTKKCDCDPGYTEKDLHCRKMSVMEYQRTQPCATDEKRVSELLKSPHPFHAGYLKNLRQEDCVKNPCTFDALTGRSLSSEIAFHENNWGCVCNPSYGLFGVQLLPNNKKYLKDGKGFDACASIFLENPEKPIDVKLITYFYIRDREPYSIILFENVPRDKLNSHFKNANNSFMIGHTLWRHDFAQHFFSKHPIRLRMRKKDEPKSFRSVERYNLEFYVDFHPPFCREGGSPNMDLKTAYSVLYENPICLAPSTDSLFGDRYIVRPEHVLYHDHVDDTPRYNAFVLEYDADAKRWSLDLDYPYKVDFYREEVEQGAKTTARWYT